MSILKKCKGTGKAMIFNSCGEQKQRYKYGLCIDCFKTWLFSTEEGGKVVKSYSIKAKKEVTKRKRIERVEEKRSVKRHKATDIYNSTAWKYLSKYVLLYYSIDGEVQCSTSKRWYILPNKNIHAGHYYKATQNSSIAFEFKNLAPQSAADNIHGSGKPEIMREWIEETHGKGTLEWLEREKNKTVHLDKYTLDQIKEKYKKLFNELVKTKGNPWKL